MASKSNILENIDEVIAIVSKPSPLSVTQTSINSPSAFLYGRTTSNVSELVINEDQDIVFLINGDEKQGFECLSIASPKNQSDETNILWEGTIFDNVQSLRHFKDSKAFVDHVLKTGDLQTLESYFRSNILEFRLPKNNGMSTSKSFASLSSLSGKSQIKKLVKEQPMSPKMHRLGSFSNVTALGNQYHSVMDEFMKSRYCHYVHR